MTAYSDPTSLSSSLTSFQTIAQAPSSSDPALAGAAMTSNAPTASTKAPTAGNLRKVAPQVYKAMEMGIGWQICSQMHKNDDHLKEIEEKARRDSEA